jgi:hypothetical protein
MPEYPVTTAHRETVLPWKIYSWLPGFLIKKENEQAPAPSSSAQEPAQELIKLYGKT